MESLESVASPDQHLKRTAAADGARRVLPGLQRGGAGGGQAPRAVGRPPVVPVETPIGADERKPIPNMQLHPWRCVCSLNLPFGYFGTGFLVGPRTVVTAGHCVHDEVFGGWAASVEVVPARDGNSQPFGAVVSRRFSTVPQWRNERQKDYDIGCIHLESPLGEQTGWLSVAALPGQEILSAMLEIGGYPVDLGGGRHPYAHAKSALHVSERRIFYDVDTGGGTSGGPVMIRDAEREVRVVGIHTYGTNGTPATLEITANSATRITNAVLDLVEGWISSET